MPYKPTAACSLPTSPEGIHPSVAPPHISDVRFATGAVRDTGRFLPPRFISYGKVIQSTDSLNQESLQENDDGQHILCGELLRMAPRKSVGYSGGLLRMVLCQLHIEPNNGTRHPLLATPNSSHRLDELRPAGIVMGEIQHPD
jgi:hypothetical protein